MSHEVQQNGSATTSFWPTTRQPTLARCVKVPYMVVARAAALQHRKLTGRLTASCCSCAEQIRPKGTMECQEARRHDLLSLETKDGRTGAEATALSALAGPTRLTAPIIAARSPDGFGTALARESVRAVKG